MLAFTLIFTVVGFTSSGISCVKLAFTYVAPPSILITSFSSFVVIFNVPVPSGFFSTETSYLFSPETWASLSLTLIFNILCSSNGWTTLRAVAVAPVALSVAVIIAVPISWDTSTPSVTVTTSGLLDFQS